MNSFKIKLARHFKTHFTFYVLMLVCIFIDLGSKWLAFRSIPHRVVYVKDPFGIAKTNDPEKFRKAFHKEYENGLLPFAILPGEWPIRINDCQPPKATVIPKFLGIQLSFNPGAMFGMLPNATFLILFTVVALGVIIWILNRLTAKDRAYRIGLALIAAGAIANLWDRIFHHAVRDFIDVSVEFWGWLASWLIDVRNTPAGAHWPTFNPADIFIVVGVGLILIKQFTTRKTETETSKES